VSVDGDDVTQRLRKLAEQNANGTISDDDYAQRKQALLGRPGSAAFSQATQMMPAVQPNDEGRTDRSTRPGRSMLLLVIAVGVVILVLIAVVWLTGAGLR
jgi:hypothetical protein